MKLIFIYNPIERESEIAILCLVEQSLKNEGFEDSGTGTYSKHMA